MTSQDAIWAYYQNQATESFAGSRARLAYLLGEIRRRRLHRVLNIGIGGGLFERMAQAQGLMVCSLDPDAAAVQRLCDQLGIDARPGSAQAMPFNDDSFDAVVASEVLEHLDAETLAQALVEIQRVLVPGGVFIGTVPYQENLLDSTMVCPHCGKRFHRWGHAQSFSAETLRDTLSGHFAVERVFPRLFVTFSELNWKGKMIAVIRLFLWKMGLYRGKPNLVFIARKPQP